MRFVARNCWLYLIILATPWSAMATLGGTRDTIATDATKLTSRNSSGTQNRAMPAIRNITPADETRFQVRSFLTEDGTEVHEYISHMQLVFAVTWSGPSAPDLAQLLGDSYAAFDQQGEQQEKDPMYSIRSSVNVDTDKLKIYSGGRSPNFHGRAYLPALLPPGVSMNDLR